MLSLVSYVSHLINHLGYIAVFGVLFVECFGVPSPDEIILVFSGYLAFEHHFSYPLVILFAVLGSTAGATGAYFLARLGGRPVMLKYFGFIFRTPERLDYWENYFSKKGEIVVLIGRIISGVRAIISYPAGLFQMPYWRFLIYTVIGSLIWALLAVTVGYMLGPHIITALEASKKYEDPIIGGLVVLAILWILWERRKKRRRGPEGSQSNP